MPNTNKKYIVSDSVLSRLGLKIERRLLLEEAAAVSKIIRDYRSGRLVALGAIRTHPVHIRHPLGLSQLGYNVIADFVEVAVQNGRAPVIPLDHDCVPIEPLERGRVDNRIDSALNKHGRDASEALGENNGRESGLASKRRIRYQHLPSRRHLACYDYPNRTRPCLESRSQEGARHEPGRLAIPEC